MPIFECTKCHCVDNTACADYWDRVISKKKKPLCTECETGKWHNIFPKKSAKGYLIGSDGFLYHEDEDLEWRKKHQGFKITGEVK